MNDNSFAGMINREISHNIFCELCGIETKNQPIKYFFDTKTNTNGGWRTD